MIAEADMIIRNQKRTKIKKSNSTPWLLRGVRLVFGTVGRVFPKPFARVAFRFFTTPRRRAKHKTSDSILEAARVSEMLVGKNMIKMYEWGEGENTILLVHGWESRGTALRSFVTSLVDAGYRVAAFDAPAHGDSGGKRVNLVTYSEAFKALYGRYKNVEYIITHSFGGAAVIYAMTKLDSTMAVKKMVMIASPASISYPVLGALQTMNASSSVKKYFIKNIERIADMKLADLTFEKVNRDLKIKKILLVHDKQDKSVVFSEAEKMVKQGGDKVELQVTDGFGHFSLIKNKEVISRVTNFLITKK